MDERWIQNINSEKRYRPDEVAAKTVLNCSISMIYKLIYLGELDYLKVGSDYRIPGWSIIDYTKRKENK